MEQLNDNEFISLLNSDLSLIKKIKNPSLVIQEIVVKKDIECFKFIKTPDIKVIEYVAKLKPSLLREDMFDIESVQKILISKNPRYAKRFTKISNEVKQMVAQNMPSLLNYENDESLQRVAFISNSSAIKYFKDCCLLDVNEIVDKCPAVACIYLNGVEKDLISKHINHIAPIFYGKINEYTEDIIRYVFNYQKDEIRYLSYDKMLKVKDIEKIINEVDYFCFRYIFKNAPYDIFKNAIIRNGWLCSIIDFKDECEILNAINSNPNVLKFLKFVPENILPNIPRELYSEILYFGEVSKETQKNLLNCDVKLAGKIKNLDLDLVREFCAYDDSIVRYSRVLDDDLISYGIIFGFFNSNEFVGIAKNKLIKIMFLSKKLKRR